MRSFENVGIQQLMFDRRLEYQIHCANIIWKVFFTSVLTKITRCKDKSFNAFETSSGITLYQVCILCVKL